MVALRKKSGKFLSYADLLRVKGLGKKTLKKMPLLDDLVNLKIYLFVLKQLNLQNPL